MMELLDTTVSVTGVGFARNSIITLKYDSNTLSTSPSTITSDNQGEFSASFTVPDSTAGNHLVSAIDTTSETAQEIFTIEPAISANPAIGPRYTSIDLSGSGFAGSSPITIIFGDISILTQPITDSTGSFQTTFDVPNSAVIGSNSIDRN